MPMMDLQDRHLSLRTLEKKIADERAARADEMKKEALNLEKMRSYFNRIQQALNAPVLAMSILYAIRDDISILKKLLLKHMDIFSCHFPAEFSELPKLQERALIIFNDIFQQSDTLKRQHVILSEEGLFFVNLSKFPYECNSNDFEEAINKATFKTFWFHSIFRSDENRVSLIYPQCNCSPLLI